MARIGQAVAEELPQVFDLRWRVLREPLGEARGSEVDEFDDMELHPETIHGVALESGLVIATGRVHQSEDPSTGQVRYMATDPAYRGRSIGSQVLMVMEVIAQRNLGIENIVLNARTEALSLYERAGYAAVGPELTLHGLQHVPMQKSL